MSKTICFCFVACVYLSCWIPRPSKAFPPFYRSFLKYMCCFLFLCCFFFQPSKGLSVIFLTALVFSYFITSPRRTTPLNSRNPRANRIRCVQDGVTGQGPGKRVFELGVSMGQLTDFSDFPVISVGHNNCFHRFSLTRMKPGCGRWKQAQNHRPTGDNFSVAVPAEEDWIAIR